MSLSVHHNISLPPNIIPDKIEIPTSFEFQLNHRHDIPNKFTFQFNVLDKSIQCFFYGLAFLFVMIGVSYGVLALGSPLLASGLSNALFEIWNFLSAELVLTTLLLVLTFVFPVVIWQLGWCWSSPPLPLSGMTPAKECANIERKLVSATPFIEDPKAQILETYHIWLKALDFPKLYKSRVSLGQKISNRLEEFGFYQESLDLATRTSAVFTTEFGKANVQTLWIKLKIASAHFGMKNYTEVIEVCDAALEHLPEQENSLLRLSLMNYKMVSLGSQEKFLESLEICEKILNDNSSIQNEEQLPLPGVPLSHGVLLYKLDKLDAAFDVFNEAMENGVKISASTESLFTKQFVQNCRAQHARDQKALMESLKRNQVSDQLLTQYKFHSLVALHEFFE